MNYEIREMQPEDATKIIEIFEEGIAGGNATFDPAAPTWEGWDQKYFNMCRFVLENENEEIVGWAALQPISNRDCFKGVAEVSIYLTGSVQGKGLGSMLLKKLIVDSEAVSYTHLDVYKRQMCMCIVKPAMVKDLTAKLWKFGTKENRFQMFWK